MSGNVLLFILLNLYIQLEVILNPFNTLCTKGPDLQIPSIEAKQDGTLRPNYPLAAEPLPDSTVLSTYLYKGADKKHRGAGRLCKQD